jgi:Xaa-Pro aminopeptidase
MTVLTKDDFKAKYGISDVVFVEDMTQWLKDRNADKVYLNAGTNSDSGMENMIPEEKYWKDLRGVDKDTIYEVLANTRVTKTSQEIDVMRWATKITVEGHVEVLKKIRDGMRESDLESIFKAYCE